MISPSDITAAGMWVTSVETGALVSDPWLSRWGISLKYHPELGASGITGMTQEQAVAILTSDQYWLPEWNALPQYLVIPMLSFSVLEGPTQASYALQRALGVKVDGDVGQNTIAAAATVEPKVRRDPFLKAFFRTCRQRFAESPRWVLDGEGWETRQLGASLAAKVWQ